MNRHMFFLPVTVFSSFWSHRNLIWQMTKREVIGRYRGSIMGLLWSFLNPLLMLAVYTAVFGVVFRSRWGQSVESSRTEFAITLFAGLIVYNFFAEIITRAPGVIVCNINYVKKVIFPLEILPLIICGSALFHAFVSVLVLLLFQTVISWAIPWHSVFFPVILLPFMLMTMGCSWFLASVGVYVRDVSQPIGVIVTALLFLSPVLYPASSLPEQIRGYLFINPLTFIIEQSRAVLVFAQSPNWDGLIIYTLLTLPVTWIGLLWFQKTRKGFADVL